MRTATFAELGSHALHDILRLRINVFVVEQACPYAELDGRDVEESTVHLWTGDHSGPTAYLRLLDDGDVWRIGRVCTRVDARGRGLAADLMTFALAREATGREVVLDAQSYLSGWYARFGFQVDGAEFVEDGIAHVPMRREARRT